MITTFKHNNKSLAIINVYRLPCSLSKGPRCCVIQYNIKDGQVKNTNTCRKRIFQQIKQYITNNNIDDIIIRGDFNQNIAVNKLRKFLDNIGIKDIHSITNFINMNDLDNTSINSRYSIDSMAASFGIMQYIKGCQLLGNNDILYLDHRAYIIGVNFEECFNDNFS